MRVEHVPRLDHTPGLSVQLYCSLRTNIIVRTHTSSSTARGVVAVKQLDRAIVLNTLLVIRRALVRQVGTMRRRTRQLSGLCRVERLGRRKLRLDSRQTDNIHITMWSMDMS